MLNAAGDAPGAAPADGMTIGVDPDFEPYGQGNLSRTLRRAWTAMRPHGDMPPLEGEFYPYTELKGTISREGRRYHLRVSDGFQKAPREAVRGLATMLLSRINTKLRPTPYQERCIQFYELWVNSREAREINTRLRRKRGHKMIVGAQGDHYNLNERFAALNRSHFGGELRKPRLTWSTRASYHTFGHHDEALDTIVISSLLDSARIPRFVLDYVLFHEMLHLRMGSRYDPTGSRCVHTPAFRRREEKFPAFTEANDWLTKLYERGAKNRRRLNTTFYAAKRIGYNGLPKSPRVPQLPYQMRLPGTQLPKRGSRSGPRRR